MGPDGQAALNLGGASSAQFSLLGGDYGVTVHAGTWSSGSVTLQRIGPDGSTLITVLTAFSTDGYAVVRLPPGTYQFTVATATGVYASILHIPRSGN